MSPIHSLLVVLVIGCCCQNLWAGVILQYHSVSDSMPLSTSVTPDRFAEHMLKLEQEGYQVVRLDHLLERVRSHKQHDRMVAITFDDGFANIARNALPEIEKRGWQTALFVTTGQVGVSEQMLSVEQLQEIHQRGHLVLNHGSEHEHMVPVSEQVLQLGELHRVGQNILRAQRQLESWLGETVPRYLAWPYGEHSPDLEKLAASLRFTGFAQNTGALSHDMNWQAIPRIPVNQHYSEWSSLKDKLDAIPLPVKRQQPVSGVTTAPRPVLRFALNRDWSDKPIQCFIGGRLVEVEKDTVEQGEQLFWLQLQSPGDLQPGRHRYTCTAPAWGGRYYWFSKMWMRHEPGNWYQD